MSESEGLEGEGWAQQEFGEAPLGDRRLSRRLVESAQRQAQEPGRAFTGVARGDRAAVKDTTADRPAGGVGSDGRKHPGAARPNPAADAGAAHGGASRTEAPELHASLLGVIATRQERRRGDCICTRRWWSCRWGCSGEAMRRSGAGGHARRAKKTYRWIEGLRDCAEVSRSLDGVRVVSVVDREADFFALFAEQRASGGGVAGAGEANRVLERKAPGRGGRGNRSGSCGRCGRRRCGRGYC